MGWGMTEEQKDWLDTYQFPQDSTLLEALDQFVREFHLAPEDAAEIVGEFMRGTL